MRADSGTLNDLANALKRRGQRDEARALYRRALELEPGAPHASYNLAKMFREDGAVDAAMRLLDELIASQPGFYRAWHDRGVCLEELGRFEDAIAQYQAVLQMQPDHLKALANLIAIGSFRPEAALIERAEMLLRHGRHTREDQARLHCALGKYYDRQCEFDRAFAHFASSHAGQERTSGDHERREQFVTSLIQGFDARTFGALRASGHESNRPVFIVGMPRSGTTLVEQILASHPAVFGAGELAEIPAIVREIGSRYPLDLASMDAGVLSGYATRYLSALDQRAPAGAIRVIDKLPGNFAHLGLIATLFPRATVICCRRDPLDVTLSCFIERFAGQGNFATGLQSIAYSIVQHERLMSHWRAVLPIAIHDCDYATLVDDQASETRRLLDHCGLKWHDECRDFFRSERHVQTPSRWQVRQPMYRSSISRWRNYRRHLEPAARILADAGLLAPAAMDLGATIDASAAQEAQPRLAL